MFRPIARRDIACVTLALRDMLGEYENQWELEELLEELVTAGELTPSNILRYVPEYLPNAFFFTAPKIIYNAVQTDEYATFIDVDMGIRYRMLRNVAMIVVYNDLKYDVGHAQCLLAHGYYLYLDMSDRGQIALSMCIFNRRDQ